MAAKKKRHFSSFLLGLLLLVRTCAASLADEERRRFGQREHYEEHVAKSNLTMKTSRNRELYQRESSKIKNSEVARPGVSAGPPDGDLDAMITSASSPSAASPIASECTNCFLLCSGPTDRAGDHGVDGGSHAQRRFARGIWPHVLLVAVDVDGTFLIPNKPSSGYAASLPVSCGDSTAALFRACRSRQGVDTTAFDQTMEEAVARYMQGYSAVMKTLESKVAHATQPQERLRVALSEIDAFEERVASTPLTRQLLRGVHVEEIDRFMNSAESPMQLPHAGAPETLLQLFGKGVPVSFISLAWSSRLVLQALRGVFRLALRRATRLSDSPLLFPLQPQAFDAATSLLPLTAELPCAAPHCNTSSSSSSSSSLAVRTLVGLAAEGDDPPANLPLLAVEANELEVDANGFTTGELIRNVVTFSDKGRAFRRRLQWAATIRKQQQQSQREAAELRATTTTAAATTTAAPAAGENAASPGEAQKVEGPSIEKGAPKWTVYIGDSDGDIAGFLEADIPIFVGPPSLFTVSSPPQTAAAEAAAAAAAAGCERPACMRSVSCGVYVQLGKLAGLQLCPLDYLRCLDGESVTSDTSKIIEACLNRDAGGNAANDKKIVFYATDWQQIYALFFGAWPPDNQETKVHA
ncbi:hypothetical protein Emag_003368 [Eimeria magna]